METYCISPMYWLALGLTIGVMAGMGILGLFVSKNICRKICKDRDEF